MCLRELSKALLAAAAKAEAYYLEEAKKQDGAARDTFAENGVEIAEMSKEEFDAWRAIAQETAYKAFLEGSPEGQKLLDLALAVE